MNYFIECWLPVPGYEGLYEVSDLGRVRSLDRIVAIFYHDRPGTKRIRGKVLSQGLSLRGYPTVQLSRDGVKTTHPVHLLVLKAFVGPPGPGQEGRHGRHGKLDNRLSELCWGTRAENIADRVRDGVASRGARNGSAKLTDAKVRTIRIRCAAGETQRVIAADFGVSKGSIGDIASRRTWAHVA